MGARLGTSSSAGFGLDTNAAKRQVDSFESGPLECNILVSVSDKVSPSSTSNTSGEQKMYSHGVL